MTAVETNPAGGHRGPRRRLAAVNEILGPRFEQAIAYAALLHADQRRKGGDIPYLAHLMARRRPGDRGRRRGGRAARGRGDRRPAARRRRGPRRRAAPGRHRGPLRRRASPTSCAPAATAWSPTATRRPGASARSATSRTCARRPTSACCASRWPTRSTTRGPCCRTTGAWARSCGAASTATPTRPGTTAASPGSSSEKMPGSTLTAELDRAVTALEEAIAAARA